MGNFFGMSSPAPSTESVRERLDRGWALIDQGKHAEAMDLFQGVLNEEPRNGEALGGRGKVHKLQKNTELAILDLDKAAQLVPNNPWYMTELADAYDDAGNGDKACECARAAIRAGSKAPLNHALLGRYHLKAKAWKECEEELKVALNLSPGYAWALQLMGDYYYNLEQWGMAVPFYRETMRVNPKVTYQLEKLSEVYLWKLELVDPALEVLNRWLELAPNTLLAWERRCEVYLRKKMSREAMEAATRSVEIDPNDAWANCYLSKAHRLAGNIDAARAAVRRALEIDPNNDHAKWLQGDIG